MIGVRTIAWLVVAATAACGRQKDPSTSPQHDVERIEFCGEPTPVDQTHLYCYGQPVDIGELARFPRVRFLELDSARPTNLDKLRAVPLTVLRLRDVGIRDLEFLENHATLQYLMVQEDPWQAFEFRALSVHPLRTVSELRRLELLTTSVDLNELGSLENLTSLVVSASGHFALAEIAGLTRLRELSVIGDRQVFDLAPLANLSGLETLDINGPVATTTLAPLAKLPRLKTLRIRSLGEIVEPTPLAKLRELQIRDWTQPDLQALGDMPKLESLVIRSSMVPDETPDLGSLVRYRRLRTLELPKMRIRDLRPLAALDRLERLNLAANLISLSDARLTPLAALTALESLDVSENKITDSDLESLVGLSRLAELNLSLNPIHTLEPLARLRSLRVLSVAGTEITGLDPLAKLTALERLNIAANPGVTSVEPLRELRELEWLYIYETPIADLSPVAGVKRIIPPPK